MIGIDVMIGDYVKHSRYLYIKVASITKKKIGFHLSPGESRMRYVRLCEVSPIPIDDEKLARNGWRYNEEDAKFAPETWTGGGVMLQKEDDGFRIVTVSDYDDEDTNQTPFVLNYIHELQHALKLRKSKKEIKL